MSRLQLRLCGLQQQLIHLVAHVRRAPAQNLAQDRTDREHVGAHGSRLVQGDLRGVDGPDYVHERAVRRAVGLAAVVHHGRVAEVHDAAADATVESVPDADRALRATAAPHAELEADRQALEVQGQIVEHALLDLGADQEQVGERGVDLVAVGLEIDPPDLLGPRVTLAAAAGGEQNQEDRTRAFHSLVFPRRGLYLRPLEASAAPGPG